MVSYRSYDCLALVDALQMYRWGNNVLTHLPRRDHLCPWKHVHLSCSLFMRFAVDTYTRRKLTLFWRLYLSLSHPMPAFLLVTRLLILYFQNIFINDTMNITGLSNICIYLLNSGANIHIALRIHVQALSEMSCF